MLEIEEIYKQRFPNAIMRSPLVSIGKTSTKNYQYITASDADLKEYEQWKNSRRANQLQDLPEIHIERIRHAISRILEDHPSVLKIWLTGSFVAGDWLDETTPSYYKELKQRVAYKDKISDYDFITYPMILSHTPDYHLIHEVLSPKFEIMAHDWDLKALPKKFHKRAISLRKNNKYPALQRLLMEHKVVPCATCLTTIAMQTWIDYAIHEKIYTDEK